MARVRFVPSIRKNSLSDETPLIRYTYPRQACVRCAWCKRVIIDKPSALLNGRNGNKSKIRVFCNSLCHSHSDSEQRKGRGRTGSGSTGKTWKRKGPPSPGAFKKGQNIGEKHPRWTPRVTVQCKRCGDDIVRARYDLKPGRDYYCVEKKCFSAWRKEIVGALHHSYRGGHDEYRGAKWDEQRLVAVERDKGTCQKCKKVVGAKIDVHHIVPYQFCKQHKEANEPENLICLCSKCHKLVEWQTVRLYSDLGFIELKKNAPIVVATEALRQPSGSQN